MFLHVAVLALALLLYRRYREAKRVPNKSEKHVYITGCDSGFGSLLARHLDKLGFRVVAACLTDKGEDQLRKGCSDRLRTVHLDVADHGSVAAAASCIREMVGEGGLWALVNNAGVSLPAAPCDWLTISDYKAMLAVNLNGVIDVTLSVLPLIKKARGRVVNVASVYGRISPIGGPYCVSKYGVEAFNDGLRRNMAPFGVEVLCIEPGFFKTAMTDVDMILNNHQRLWDRLSQDLKDDYGSDYLAKVELMLKSRLVNMLDGDLMKVVNCMEHAVAAVHPRTRYSAGWDAKLFWLPLSYMPTCVADRILSKEAIKLKVSRI
ncbi:dehydrogenase/reductase SDR family member 9 [Denticeps clupeoides]|uniref:Uncharacterized protein n=1 Tax=Denticeps clupeoides TaxID=299321 RepID=A0AAY4B463_9TELE|nr:retinol dehydrogenase 7-like [Denticeps clupeoides]XP_028847268.1 retinol dehydrogenase 7-like [Denticeps clupeoides]